MPDINTVPEIKELGETFERVALFGGVYNNHVALKKACELASLRGCGALFQLGDLGGFGPSPNKVFPLLKKHRVRCIRGNYEESLIKRLTDCGCGYTHPQDNYYARLSYDYTDKYLSDENRKYLETFPQQIQFRLGPLTVHLCHGSPRRTNEFLWETTTAAGFIRTLSRDLQFDVLCCTHTGLHWKREVSPEKWIVNVGALGRPANNGAPNVWYAELSWENGGLKTEFIKVDYDHQALAQEMREEKLPTEFIEAIITGYWTTCLEILPGKERQLGAH